MKERDEGKYRKLSEKIIFMLRSSHALLHCLSDKVNMMVKALEWLETTA
jgi:hypothetical protein